MINDLDIKGFQKLCLEEYDLEITEQKAFEYGSALIELLINISDK